MSVAHRSYIVLEAVKSEIWEASNEYVTHFRVVNPVSKEVDFWEYSGSERYEPGDRFWVYLVPKKGVDNPPLRL